MPSLGSLWYNMGIRDLTDADLQKINAKFKNLGFDIQLTPKILKDLTQSAVPRGIKIELDPTIKNEALARAVEGKVMRVQVMPLITQLRKALREATKENPPEMEVGVQSVKLRRTIENVLNRQGFMLNVSTVNDNYSKAIQAKLNGTRYNVKIHADANEITRSVQASLMQVQSRRFGLQVSRDMLYRSIDEALGQKRFNINIAVQHDQARRAVQDALLRAQVIGKDHALAYQRLQTGEMKAAQAELLRLKAAHQEAANAAKAHATASVNLGGAMGSNIKIAGELGSAMTSLYSIHAAKQFLSQVIEIGGELEHQKIAMNTIFGDEGKQMQLSGQIKGLARNSPFGVMELMKSVKALSAYGVQYNEIYETAKRLADISAATSVDINRLILAFGKTRSRGFLDGWEAKQFAYANIPIYEMVRKKLEELEGQAITTADVMARMKKREISFDIVKDVLWDITDPGGKFYDMQEALAGSVKTSWKLVRDNIELMFGEIAESAVGNTLKSTAEILQGLTREWRTVGAVVAAAAVGLGIYRVATIGLNQVMQKGTATAYQNLMAEKQRDAQRLRSLSLVMDLTAAEKARIATANRLTNAELAQALKTEKLTLAQIEQLFVTGKLNKANIMYLFRMRLIDKEGARAILTHNRLAISIKSVGMAMASVGKAIGAFLLNPWTIAIAAISGIAALWQRHNEQLDKSKEIGDNLFTRATESAKNLKAVLAEIGNEVEKLTDIKIAEAISKLETAIKDYSPTPEKTLRETRLDEGGKIRSSQEYAKALQAEVKALEEAATLEEKIDIGKISENAMNNAKGILDDNLAKDLEQYADSFKKADSEISKYISDNPRKVKQYVDRLTEIDSGFAEATKGMDTYAAKFREMVVNTDKYSTAALAIEGGDIQNLLSIFTSTIFTDERSLIGRLFSSDPQAMKKDRREFETELKAYMGYVKSALEEEGISVGEGINMSKPVQIMMSRLANTILENAKSLPQDQQDAIRELWNSFFGLDFDDTLIFGGISDRVKDSLDKSPKVLSEKLRNGISYDELKGADKELVDEVIESSAQEVEKKFPHLTNKIHDKLKSEKFIAEIVFSLGKNAALSGWQRQLNDAIGDEALKALDISIGGKADIDSFIDEARKGYKAANEAIKELKPILIKAGIDFVEGQEITAVPLSLKGNDVALQAIDEYNKKIQATKAIKNALKEQGIDLDVDPNKNPRTQKDPLAESLKQRFKDIKDAWSEFQKWSKTEGREAAATRIGESGLFSTLSVEQIPQTVEQYRALVVQLENELRKAGVKGTAREGLLNDLLKQLLDIDKTIVDEQLKLALDKVSKEAERQLADWNLFDKIRKATGNDELAMSIGFGLNADAETDYPKLIEQQLDKQAKAYEDALAKKNKGYTTQSYTYSSLKELYDKANAEGATEADMNAWLAVPEEIRKAWEKANGDILKYFDQQRDAVADILNEYQSLQDKLTKIDADRDRKIKTVQESDMSAPDKAKYIQRIKVEADYQKFTQSADYLKFFSGIYSLTMDKAQEIGDKIRMYLDQRLQAGKISAEDYYKEIDRINQQISKLRNVKSDALTFMTGGLKGLNQKKLEIADSNVLDQMTKVQQAQEALEKAKATGDVAQIASAQMTLNLARHELDTRLKIRDAIVKDMEGWQKVLDVVNIAANIAGGLSDAFNSIKDMADAFGVDTETGGWLDVGGVLDTLSSVTSGVSKVIQSAMSGDIGGILSGAVSTITTPFTIWAQIHDKKLQKMIERSKEYSQQLQNINDAIERRMENYLGNARTMRVERAEEDKVRLQQLREQASRNLFLRAATRPERERLEKREKAYEEGGAYGYQRQLMAEQLSELEKQRQAELDKKKTDNSVVADYDNQIDEMKVKIRQFAEEAAKDLYGIDLKDWASQLGDALFDAWKKGEDGAEAFKKKAGDILGDVMNSVLKLGLLEPMMQDIQTYLFGEDGKSGAFGEDFELTPDELDGLAAKLMAGMEGVDAYNSALDQLEKILNEKYGLSMKGDKESKSGLSAGIQSVTEDTADLLASYLNGIRGDVSVQTHVLWPKLLDDALPQMNVIAQSQLDAQRQIAENTLRNAVAAEAIMKSSDEINRRLARVTQGGEKFYVH